MSTIPIPTRGPRPPRLDKYQLLEEEYHRVRDELTQARATIDNYDRELRRRNEELREASQYIDHLQHEDQRSKDSITGLQNELNNVRQQLEDAKALSEVGGKELFGAQAQVDRISISEVGEKVTALNEKISHAAVTLGESIVHKRYEVSQTELDAAAAVCQEMFGEKITNILITQSQKPETKKTKVNPLLFQVVLENFMVKFCVPKIQSWFPNGDSVIGGFLSAIYSEIRSNEEQSVSGRWRAITRAHTRPSTEKWKKELIKKLQSALKIASWKMVKSLGDEDPLKSFELHLPSIFKAINELRMAIGEKFTSADLDIFVFECDKIYDPANMDNAFDDGKHSSSKRAPEAILGTTGIGLGKVMVDRGANLNDVLQVRTLIPANIVLASTMNEILEPPGQSTRFKKKKKQVEKMDGANQDGRD